MLLKFSLTFLVINYVYSWDLLPNPDVSSQVEIKGGIIYMDENIKNPITVAYINYEGENAPTIGDYLEPTPNSGSALGAKINGQSAKWGLEITKEQDFDNKDETFRYAFEINVENTAILKVYLKLRNTDDNPPFIEVDPSSNPCKINENYIGETNCILTITDDDGIVDNMKYTLGNSVVNDINGYFEVKNVAELADGTKKWQTVLYVKKELDFETMSSYMLDFTVTDSGNNSDSTKVVVQVQDLPDTPPVWSSVLSYITIPEKEKKIETVVAYDGDIGINADINYEIISERKDLFKVNVETGEVTIGPVDRDQEKQEIFSFNIKAYEKDDTTSNIVQTVTLIVQDKNDNIPQISVTEDKVFIEENSITTLATEIEVNDLDLGENATYKVSLTETKFSEAFRITPPNGYQNAKFFISVVNSEPLDYEDKNWRNFDLEILAVETADPTHSDKKTVHISLKDLNDEPPVFEKDEYNVNIAEDVAIGASVATVLATDADDGDTVIYSLLGSAKNTFTISSSGVIETKVANAFDYEKMQMVIIQVSAEDTNEKPHKATAQVTITVTDVNDETPSISVEELEISVTENEKIGVLINDKTIISASDPDTKPLLKFSINWDRSSAVKNGRKVPQGKGCLIVETADFDRATRSVQAYLKVSNNNIDYELFDTLYILLVVTDENQNIGNRQAEVQITISILDENDNPPTFVPGTIASKKKVIERSRSGIVIGTVTATDIDGPGNNNVTYSIRPLNKTIPDTWVNINDTLGEIYVAGDQEIDADLPIQEIIYCVKASDPQDSLIFSEEQITIEVIDTNNKAPTCEFESEVHILEASQMGTSVSFIKKCQDGDRDVDYSTPWFELSRSIPTNSFSIDIETGDLHVITPEPKKDLDRDNGRTSLTLGFWVKDNRYLQGSNVQNGTEYMVTIVLDDINDNPPIIQTEEVLNANENMAADYEIGSITATDKDEEDSDNSKINFTIIEIIKDPEVDIDPPNDLFQIRVDDYHLAKATLFTGRNLRAYYGTYGVNITVEDYGIPRQNSSKIIKVNVKKYNFLPPVFTFPSNKPIYLAKTQPIGSQLFTMSGGRLQPFAATDQQDEKWNILITIDSETNPNDTFGIYPLGNNKADLILNRLPTQDAFKLKLIADCQCTGAEPFQSEISANIRFVDTDSEPIFPNPSTAISFLEGEVDLERQLPKAFFNEAGEDWDGFVPYYFLQTISMSEYFKIGKETAILTLIKELDREAIDHFEIKVTTSKNEIGSSEPAESSVLTVLVSVLDKNDETPYFTKEQYNKGIKPSDVFDSSILTLQAIDLDDEDELYFKISGDIKAIGEEISNLEVPFYLKPGSKVLQGNITADVNVHLNFSVRANMAGYFHFEVMVTDGASHENKTTVKIYIVSESSRVAFQFENDISTITSQEGFIKDTLEDVFGYVCNVDAIVKSTNDEGEVINGRTDFIVYFVNDETNEAVPSKRILQLLSNPEIFSKLKSPLQKVGMQLLNTNYFQEPENSEEKFKAWLIAVSVVLGTLCAVLIIAFVVKTRSLLKRLNKLSVPKFGSQDSGLNRIGLAAPTTNKNATEGSNPIYRDEKRAPEIDRYSVGSGDSDLIGVEDNPNFEYKSDINGSFITNPPLKKKEP